MSRYGGNLTPAAPSSGSRIGTKGRGSRGRREPSGVFTLFQPAQVQQFREAFSLIDQDGDGTVSEEDLKRIFASLGERLCSTWDLMLQVLVRPGLNSL
jgi:myosin regulatory light chain 12